MDLCASGLLSYLYFPNKKICGKLFSLLFCYSRRYCLPLDKTVQDVSELDWKCQIHSGMEKYTALFRNVKAISSAEVAKSVHVENKARKLSTTTKINLLAMMSCHTS